VIESRHKGSNKCSIRSPEVKEERTRPGRWLSSVLCLFFSAPTLWIGQQEGYPARKKL